MNPLNKKCQLRICMCEANMWVPTWGSDRAIAVSFVKYDRPAAFSGCCVPEQDLLQSRAY